MLFIAKMNTVILDKYKGWHFMKSRGITRKADSMGRIVIPMEIRRSLGIVEKDSLEMFIEEDQIILRKYQSQELVHLQEIFQTAIFR